MVRTLIVCAIAFAMSGASRSLPARSTASASTTTTKKTVIRFDGEDIDGSLTRPDGDLVAGRRQSRRPPLARPPVDFEERARRDLLEAAGRLRRP
jgi:hypothetical protein